MTDFILTDQSGKKFKVTADNPQAAHAAFVKMQGGATSQPAQRQQAPVIGGGQRAANVTANADRQAQIDAMAMPKTEPQNSFWGVTNQVLKGANEGVGNTLGLPVDLMNSAVGGVGQLTGMWQPSENPWGGSRQINSAMGAATDAIGGPVPEPQTALERGARRVGQDIGGSVVTGPLAAVSAAGRLRPVASMVADAASGLGSGLAGWAAQELAPDSMAANVIASLLGGGAAGVGASRSLDLNGTSAVVRPGIDEQKARAADAYGEVRADTRILPQDSVDDLALGISSKMDAERINPRLQPGSSAILDALMQDSSGPMRIEDIEGLRRLTQQGLPATASRADQRLSGIMTAEITDYLDSLNDPVSDALKTGRDAHRRALAAQTIADAETKAARRAASTGSGGNEINAMRQNLRTILDNPRKARSFKPGELSQMSEIVTGSGGQNAMRSLSRFAPSSGGLSSMLGIGGAMASPAVALPIMAATEGAKAMGERSTRKSIAQLLQSLAPDRVLAPSNQGVSPIISALLAGRTAANQQGGR